MLKTVLWEGLSLLLVVTVATAIFVYRYLTTATTIEEAAGLQNLELSRKQLERR